MDGTKDCHSEARQRRKNTARYPLHVKSKENDVNEFTYETETTDLANELAEGVGRM